jgi:hypothetical protein
MAQPRSVYLSPQAGRGKSRTARDGQLRRDARKRHQWAETTSMGGGRNQ